MYRIVLAIASLEQHLQTLINNLEPTTQILITSTTRHFGTNANASRRFCLR